MALLTLMSVVAAREVRIASDRDREFFLGSGAPDWIDRHTASPTLLFDEGSFYWNDYWHQAYWNRRVAGVLTVAPWQAPLPDESTRGCTRTDRSRTSWANRSGRPAW